jgi:hypothetical protein
VKVGDLVKWIGFPGATILVDEKYGIIIRKLYTHLPESSDRIDVLWGGGKIGKALYAETIETIQCV